MSRRYSIEERDRALELLITNNGDVTLTSAQTGINIRTLYRWQREAGKLSLSLTTLTTNQPDSPRMSGDDLGALRNLQYEMLDEAENLVHSIKEAIAEAPLGQRVAALTQLVDRIMKLAVQLPRHDPDNTRIVFDDGTYEPNDPSEETPYEAEDDPR